MKATNRLGLTTALVTAMAFGLTYGLWQGGVALYHLATKDSGGQQIAQASPTPNAGEVAGTTDSDGDGIPDSFEVLYQTDPNNADTDSDGVDDLDEIQLGRDPLTAGPNDEIKPETGEAVFDTSTETGKYLSGLPRDIDQAEIMSEDNITAYINENAGELLPTISDTDIKTENTTGAEAIKAYLDSISATHNKDLTAVSSSDIEEAFARQLVDPDQMKNMLLALRQNVLVLKSISAPEEVVDLHKKYIAASTALADAVEMMTEMPGDLVKGLIGAKKIGDLADVFNEIEQAVTALETKYNLS